MTPASRSAWLCALALLALSLPALTPVSASHPNACDRPCVAIVKIAKEADVAGVGPTPPPIYNETYDLVHAQLDYWVGSDHGLVDVLSVRDDQPFWFNGSVGPVRWKWTEEASADIGRVYLSSQGVQKVGELWRVEVQVVQGHDVILAFPGRMVYLDGGFAWTIAQPGDPVVMSQVVEGYARDASKA